MSGFKIEVIFWNTLLKHLVHLIYLLIKGVAKEVGRHHDAPEGVDHRQTCQKYQKEPEQAFVGSKTPGST